MIIFLFISFKANVLVIEVSSIILKTIISKWDLKEYIEEASLENSSAYIGMIECLFVFAFIITNHWEGIGFLIAAKSLFRFGDLSKAKNRKLIEYILIGILLSFGLAIIFALAYQYVSSLIK